MPKNINMGGEGGRDTTQIRYIIAKRKFYVPTLKEPKLLSELELVEYFAGSNIECLECGKFFKMLGAHLYFTHLLSLNDYKIKYGIPITYALSSEYSSQKMSLSAQDRLDDNFIKNSKINLEKGRKAQRRMALELVDHFCNDCRASIRINTKALAAHKYGLCSPCRKTRHNIAVKKYQVNARIKKITIF